MNRNFYFCFPSYDNYSKKMDNLKILKSSFDEIGLSQTNIFILNPSESDPCVLHLYSRLEFEAYDLLKIKIKEFNLDLDFVRDDESFEQWFKDKESYQKSFRENVYKDKN